MFWIAFNFPGKQISCYGHTWFAKSVWDYQRERQQSSNCEQYNVWIYQFRGFLQYNYLTIVCISVVNFLHSSLCLQLVIKDVLRWLFVIKKNSYLCLLCNLNFNLQVCGWSISTVFEGSLEVLEDCCEQAVWIHAWNSSWGSGLFHIQTPCTCSYNIVLLYLPFQCHFSFFPAFFLGFYVKVNGDLWHWIVSFYISFLALWQLNRSLCCVYCVGYGLWYFSEDCSKMQT